MDKNNMFDDGVSDELKDLIKVVDPKENLKEHEYKRLTQYYQKVFTASEEGKKVLEDILLRCRYRSSTFTGNSKSYFLEGARWVSLFIMEMVEQGTYLQQLKIYEKGMKEHFKIKLNKGIKKAEEEFDLSYEQIKTIIERATEND